MIGLNDGGQANGDLLKILYVELVRTICEAFAIVALGMAVWLIDYKISAQIIVVTVFIAVLRDYADTVVGQTLNVIFAMFMLSLGRNKAV